MTSPRRPPNDPASAPHEAGAKDPVRPGRGRLARAGRRAFLVSAAVVGGGLAVGAGWVAWRLDADRRFRLPGGEGVASFGAWLTISRDGWVTVAVPNQEMGQGVMTAIPMLVADELGADPARLRAIQAPVAAVYANPTVLLDGLPWEPEDDGWLAGGARWTMDKLTRVLGVQATGGSTSLRNAWGPAREAGAAARARLVAAAAKRLELPAARLEVRAGRVLAPDGRALDFGELADEAAAIAVQPPFALQAPAQRTLIGRGIPRLDVPSKTDGSAQFGIDVRLPGQRYAAIAHAPVFGGRLLDASLAADAPAGVVLVKSERFVAVVADGWWQASRALQAAQLRWDDGPNAAVSGETIFARYARALDAVGIGGAATGDGAAKPAPARGTDADVPAAPAAASVVREVESAGDAAAALAGAATRLSAEYRVPFLAHAMMEPPNCTVRIRAGRCEIWAGNQAPTLVRWYGAAAAGVPVEATEVSTPFLGGGFGRRAEVDFVREAVEIAKAVGGGPVQTIWSREEDVRHDTYRPAVLARLDAGLDAEGRPRAWRCAIAGPSVTQSFTSRLDPRMAGGLPDKTNAEGAVRLSYALGARRTVHAQLELPVPVGYWRSVGHSYNAFFVESFVDECAHAAGADPYAYRRALLADRGAPAGADPGVPAHAERGVSAHADRGARAARFLAVLDAAARRAGWDPATAPAASRAGVRTGRGIAIAESFRSIVAQVAEVEVDEQGAIRVTRVVAAVDCGLAIDPVNVRAQIAGGIVFGLSAALSGRIDVAGGRVRQSNFHDYPVLTLADAPRIEVEIVGSGAELGGIGEVGVPPIAPAVANAVFAATGRRLRSLPLTPA